MRDDETASSLVCFFCNMCMILVWVRGSVQGAGVYGLIAAWKGAGGSCMYVWMYRSGGMYLG
jgi:hypothetical protein